MTTSTEKHSEKHTAVPATPCTTETVHMKHRHYNSLSDMIQTIWATVIENSNRERARSPRPGDLVWVRLLIGVGVLQSRTWVDRCGSSGLTAAPYRYELVCCHCVTWVSEGRAETTYNLCNECVKNVNTLQQCEGCLALASAWSSTWRWEMWRREMSGRCKGDEWPWQYELVCSCCCHCGGSIICKEQSWAWRVAFTWLFVLQ